MMGHFYIAASGKLRNSKMEACHVVFDSEVPQSHGWRRHSHEPYKGWRSHDVAMIGNV